MGTEVDINHLLVFTCSFFWKNYMHFFFYFFISVPSSDCCDSSLVAQIVTKVKELGKIRSAFFGCSLPKAYQCMAFTSLTFYLLCENVLSRAGAQGAFRRAGKRCCSCSLHETVSWSGTAVPCMPTSRQWNWLLLTVHAMLASVLLMWPYLVISRE